MVLHVLQHENEVLPRLAERGVVVHRLPDVLAELKDPDFGVFRRAAGGDFVELVGLGT